MRACGDGRNNDGARSMVQQCNHVGYLNIVIAVHDTGKQAGAKLLYHVLQSLPLSVPGCHDAVLCGGHTHGNRLTLIQLKLQQAVTMLVSASNNPKLCACGHKGHMGDDLYRGYAAWQAHWWFE